MSGPRSDDAESQARASDPLAIDVPWLRRSFDRAAPGYDAAAVLQGEVREALLGRLDLTALEPRVVLDLGCGTGLGGQALKRRYPKARVLAVDSARGMLRVAAKRSSWLRPVERICACAERLPLRAASVDLVFCNWMLPWCRPDAVFAECRRVLAPRGLFCFTSLGPDTLLELRDAWAGVDAHCRVHRFIDMHDLGDALVRSGFASPVLDVERYTVHYAGVDALAGDLKSLGMRNAAAGRLKGLTTPRKFAAMRQRYERLRQDGRLPATCEVVFGHAWAPVSTAGPGDGASGERHISLETVKRQLRGTGQ